MSEGAQDPQPAERPAARPEPTWGAQLKWSAIMVGLSLLVALVSLPILHWLGFDPK